MSKAIRAACMDDVGLNSRVTINLNVLLIGSGYHYLISWQNLWSSCCSRARITWWIICGSWEHLVGLIELVIWWPPDLAASSWLSWSNMSNNDWLIKQFLEIHEMCSMGASFGIEFWCRTERASIQCSSLARIEQIPRTVRQCAWAGTNLRASMAPPRVEWRQLQTSNIQTTNHLGRPIELV